MNTYAMQLELHFQSDRTDDQRFDAFVEELNGLAEKHGILLGDYQSMQLRGADYTIRPCASCGHLTVDHTDVQANVENMLPDFWFYVRRGNLVSGVLTCNACEPSALAT